MQTCMYTYHTYTHEKKKPKRPPWSFLETLKRWGLSQAYFLWLSVSVMPWAETLKWTMAGTGTGLQLRAAELALATA